MTATRISYVLRHWIWRLVSAVSGGLTVTGKWRTSGGCVVVANHSSHADTAVLLAALPPKAQPVFGAAADYWFDVPVRRFIATALAGVLPVRRSGGGSLRAAAGPPPRCRSASANRSTRTVSRRNSYGDRL
jgi:1-acyl-sn-glycerol-3-phosphate acyltransferase